MQVLKRDFFSSTALRSISNEYCQRLINHLIHYTECEEKWLQWNVFYSTSKPKHHQVQSKTSGKPTNEKIIKINESKQNHFKAKFSSGIMTQCVEDNFLCLLTYRQLKKYEQSDWSRGSV